MKRFIDIMGALLGLLILSPLLVVVGLLIKLDSRGPMIFKQERIGKGFRPFLIYKYRTMVQDASRKGGLLTAGDDPRITRVGRFLRKTKLDELPQLLNVLKGDMSFVGPRPEVRRYVEAFRADYEEILRFRPGITDLASLKYRDESALLARSNDPEGEYIKNILPEKIELGKRYIRQSSLFFDLALIAKTLLKLVHSRSMV